MAENMKLKTYNRYTKIKEKRKFSLNVHTHTQNQTTSAEAIEEKNREELQNNKNTSKKMETNTYLSIMTSNVNGLGFPGGTVVKNPPANAGDMGLSPGLGRSHMPWSK